MATDCIGGWPGCNGFAATDLAQIGKSFNGISTKMTGARVGQITDGTSKTIMAGEKALPPRFYDTGYGDGPPIANYDKGNGGDNSSMYQGYDLDNTRWIGRVPAQDHDGLPADHDRDFGSAHAGGLNVALADASVQTISYDIEELIWTSYGSRDDGRTVEAPIEIEP
jgi:hypothetical protein